MAGITTADGITNPPIDDLLDVVDSKYRLVIMAAKRARQIMERLGIAESRRVRGVGANQRTALENEFGGVI